MLALQSKVETFQNQVKTLRKQAQKKNVAYDKTTEGKPKAKQINKKPSWLTNHTKPKTEDLKKSRTWNGKLWWWCDKGTGGKCDGKWRIHTPSECKGFTPKSEQKTKQGQKRSVNALKLAKANEAIIKVARFESSGSDSK